MIDVPIAIEHVQVQFYARVIRRMVVSDHRLCGGRRCRHSLPQVNVRDVATLAQLRDTRGAGVITERADQCVQFEIARDYSVHQGWWKMALMIVRIEKDALSDLAKVRAALDPGMADGTVTPDAVRCYLHQKRCGDDVH